MKTDARRTVLCATSSLFLMFCGAWPAPSRADSSHCYNIQDPDKRAFCLGSTGKKSSYCYNIRDMDWRNYCLTLADGQRSHCYNIQAKDLKSQCLAAAVK